MAKTGIFSSSADFQNRYFGDWEKLRMFLDNYRGVHKDCKIGFVGGVWDLKHLAHERYLEKAKELVDLLVVGVDTDEFTRARKNRPGIERPLISLLLRAESIAHVRSVDVITYVTEDFVSLLEHIKPDVLVFSKTTTDLAAKKRKSYGKYVKEIVLLPPQAPPEEISTSSRIRDISLAALKHAEVSAIDAIKTSFEEVKKDL